MSILLITGIQGAGKTLYAVSKLNSQTTSRKKIIKGQKNELHKTRVRTFI